jgi:hypothetical protein
MTCRCPYLQRRDRYNWADDFQYNDACSYPYPGQVPVQMFVIGPDYYNNYGCQCLRVGAH